MPAPDPRMTRMRFCLAPATLALLLAAGLADPALAAARPATSDVWQIRIGQPIGAIPEGFADFACGTNGGPPSLPLASFGEFAKCPAEPTGLHEVYFRYDDELEYWARANNFDEIVAASGTKVYGLPVVMSLLIDDHAVVRGLRLVSDPRDTSVRRGDLQALSPFLMGRFRRPGADWTCTHAPLAPGETPVNGTFVKDDCTMTAGGMVYHLSAVLVRRAGERAIDPHTGQFTEGQFDSTVRFEEVETGSEG